MGPAPLEVLLLTCESGRGASVSVAILLGWLLQKLDYAVNIQHCGLLDCDAHEYHCKSCRARRPRADTAKSLLKRWRTPEQG